MAFIKNVWAMMKQLLDNDCFFYSNAGTPVSGASGTFATIAGPGSMLTDFTNKRIYINTNTKASPTWTLLGISGFFLSTEQTGTGSSQNIAHGLGVTPSKVVIVPTDTAPATTGAYTVTQGAHTSTNVVVTVTSGKKFVALAWV